jgi:hypothetical protein
VKGYLALGVSGDVRVTQSVLLGFEQSEAHGIGGKGNYRSDLPIFASGAVT